MPIAPACMYVIFLVYLFDALKNAKLNTDNLLTLSLTAKEQRSYTEHQRASENMKRDR